MKTLPIIHKEHFEAWLASQPLRREIDYMSCSHCVVGSFLRETYGEADYSISSDEYHYAGEPYHPLPAWLIKTLFDARTYARRQYPHVFISVSALQDALPFPAVRQEQTAMDETRLGPCSSVAEEAQA